MAATGTPTPNIGLRIPIGTDPASVDDINYNSNLLDTKLGAVGSDSVQDQIDTLNGNKSNKIQTTPKSITTNTNGVADLGMTEAQTTIVAITCQDYIAIPFIVGSGRNWWVKIVGWSNMSPVASQTLSVNIMHIS